VGVGYTRVVTLYDLAIKCGVTSKVLEKRLWNMGLIVAAPASPLEADVIDAVRTMYPEPEAAAAPTGTTAAPVDDPGHATPPAPPEDQTDPGPEVPAHLTMSPLPPGRSGPGSLRVYELAARYKLDNDQVLERLKRNAVSALDHLAWLSPEGIERFEADLAQDPSDAYETRKVGKAVKRRRRLK
jgi:hypothetical protein